MVGTLGTSSWAAWKDAYWRSEAGFLPFPVTENGNIPVCGILDFCWYEPGKS